MRMVPLAERSVLWGRAGPSPCPASSSPGSAPRGYQHGLCMTNSCELKGSCRSLFSSCPICWDLTTLSLSLGSWVPISHSHISRQQQCDPEPCLGPGAQHCSDHALAPAPTEPFMLGTAGCMPRPPSALPLTTWTHHEYTDQCRFWGVLWPDTAHPQTLVQSLA